MRVLLYSITALALIGLGALAYQQSQALEGARSALAAVKPGPVEIGFAQSMSRHHQQAITMAQLMMDGRPTPLMRLARTIAGTQMMELGEMRGWLRVWNQPFVSPTTAMDWMLLGRAPPDAELSQYLIDCQRSPTGMPGLAATADLERLRALEGPTRDRLFLELMLAHHQGAIPMARFTAREAHLSAVREFATRVVVDQVDEAARMSHLLQSLAASRP